MAALLTLVLQPRLHQDLRGGPMLSPLLRLAPAGRARVPARPAAGGSNLRPIPLGTNAVPRHQTPAASGENLSRITDEELLIRHRETGRTDVFDELVRRYSPHLYRYLSRYLRDATLADDVLQDTWLQVHSKCGLYEGGRSFRAWLYAIATHQAIDALRRARRQGAASLDQAADGDETFESGTLVDLLVDAEPAPPEKLGEQERQQWVRDSVARLSEPLRQTLILADYQGLNYAEVAKALGVPIGTVKSRHAAAIARMRQMAQQAHLMEVG
jgi:RNA polymerase sigma-70 factor, ECF subfamily